MTALDIVTNYLKDNGYEGLTRDAECACELGDLAPCGEDISHCEPGYKIPCKCGDGCRFHITTKKPRRKTK